MYKPTFKIVLQILVLGNPCPGALLLPDTLSSFLEILVGHCRDPDVLRGWNSNSVLLNVLRTVEVVEDSNAVVRT